MPLLTIGIPTYNRAKYLDRLLESILPVCERKNIEVLVSDNCSTDETPKVLERYRNYKCLRRIKTAGNVGFDGNILHLRENAAGMFLWFMGDDDYIDVRYLDEILRLLESNPTIPLYYINYRSDRDKPEKKFPLSFKKISAQQYADRFMHKASLISTNVFRLDFYRQLPANQMLISTGWMNIHLLLQCVDLSAASQQKIIIVKNKAVIQGSENSFGPIMLWIKIFIGNFPYTLKNTIVKNINLKKFIKRFYDISIRPTYLTFRTITYSDNPIETHRQISAFFHPPLTSRISFWLQYFLFRKALYPFLARSK